MKINTDNLPYTMSPKFKVLLEELTDNIAGGNVTINFKDPQYSSEFGGYHPVEIRISANGEIEYITDFCYVGLGQDVELAKEIDFDFQNKVFGHLYSPDLPIFKGYALYTLWEANFIAYVEMDIFTTTVTTDE
jgi:hypothetical protein